jgi:hypothetical protein
MPETGHILNLEELCRRHDLATLILPDLKQVVIPLTR